MSKVMATVVTYNRKDLLLQCISALQEQTYPVDILVVDNASTDGTGALLQPMVEEGKIFYINTGENIGGAGGFHRGITEAVLRGYDYVWLMDDDTIATTTALQELMETAQGVGDFGFLCSRVDWVDGSVCKMNEPVVSDMVTVNGKQRVGCKQATFVSFFVPVPVVRHVGLPIKEYFIWSDDVEYSRRIAREYPCYFVGNSVVIHKTGNNVGSDISQDDESRMGRYRYAYRNEMCMERRAGPLRVARQICKIGYHCLKVLIASKGHRCKKIGIILGSSWEGISFNPAVEWVEEPRGVEK